MTGADGDTLYTRAGAFNTNADGELVTLDGYLVEPAILVPEGTIDITVNESGQVYARDSRADALQLLGQLTWPTSPTMPASSRSAAISTARRSPRAARSSAFPLIPGFGKIHQGYLEVSNVDPVKEITELISAQRAYEMNSKVIQAADEMAGTISKGIR